MVNYKKNKEGNKFMQIVQSLIKDNMYTTFSLTLTTFIVYFIIKNLKFERVEIQLGNVKYSAIVSLIVVSFIIIIMTPLILIILKNIIIKLEKMISPLSETREATWLSLAISMPKKNIRSHSLRKIREEKSNRNRNEIK